MKDTEELKQEIDNWQYLADTLMQDHQRMERIQLLNKVENLKEELKELETKTTFLCDSCGETKEGVGNPMYNNNWEIEEGLTMCDDCYTEELNLEINKG